MVKPTSYQIAAAAAQDAGNRSMRKAGRKRWSSKDYNAACAEFNRILPLKVAAKKAGK
ncbi:hypothetical protein LCGC14_0629880 [marine sediment metagenome]|uniref:Uncharacterized protein n=1 Tax=marine sediment metagenome TaxID=412755 RepID=A0A0F9TNP8_9ZZZZ